jgi:hypothetical protein
LKQGGTGILPVSGTGIGRLEACPTFAPLQYVNFTPGREGFFRPGEIKQSLVTSSATNISLRLRRAVFINGRSHSFYLRFADC